MNVLSDEELSDLGFRKHHMSTLNFHLLRDVAQEQDKYTMRQVAEYIEAHSALERLPYRDGGEWLRTIPESSWQEIKKLAEREL